MNENKNIVFRRIKGRIVPIKKSNKEPQKSHPISKVSTVKPTEQAKGSKLVFAGVGIGATGGVISGKLSRRHADLHNLARSSNGSLFRNYAARTRLEGIRASIASSRIKSGSAILGGALIYAGVKKLLKKTDLDSKMKEGIAGSSALGANFAIRTAYTKVLGNTSIKWAAKHALSRILVRGHKL